MQEDELVDVQVRDSVSARVGLRMCVVGVASWGTPHPPSSRRCSATLFCAPARLHRPEPAPTSQPWSRTVSRRRRSDSSSWVSRRTSPVR